MTSAEIRWRHWDRCQELREQIRLDMLDISPERRDELTRKIVSAKHGLHWYVIPRRLRF